MFRISSTASRSSLRRPPIPLRCIHYLHQSPARVTTEDSHPESPIDTPESRARLIEKQSLAEIVTKRRGSRGKDVKPRKRRVSKNAAFSTAVVADAPVEAQDPTADLPAELSKKKRRGKGTKTPRNAKPKRKLSPGTDRFPPDLLANPRLDVSKYLSIAFGGWRRSKPMGDVKRVNITSEKLCDDVLDRLAPSIEKYRGCDVIDINPGVGIFSSKLHERLKPRTHILLEPDHDMYQPLLQPLVDAPDSKYRLVPKSGLVWGHLETVLSKHYLPFQEAFVKDDPRLEQPNDTLLVVANLGFYPKKSYRGFASLSTLVVHQFLSAVRSHSLFQRYGHVRMMIWLSDEERGVIIPRAIAHRRKSAIEAGISCEKISEVASSTQDIGSVRREHDLDLDTGRKVLNKMEESGVGVPNGRESLLMEEISKESASEKPIDGDGIVFNYAFSKELADMEARFAAGEFKELQDVTPSRPSSKTRRLQPLTPEFERLRMLRYRKTAEDRRVDRWLGFKEQYAVIMALQKEIHLEKADGKDTELKQKEFEEKVEIWTDNVQGLAAGEIDSLHHMLDNRRTFTNDPPLLLWDRRDVEPLKVDANEFYPMQELCLLDIHPKSLWPILRRDYPANYDIFEYILSSMFVTPTQSIKKALKALYPGAYEWLVAECPSLTDPTKGGSLDLEMITVRCITEEMLKEIVEAWMKWPFRPNRHELLSRMSSSFDPDALEPGESRDSG